MITKIKSRFEITDGKNIIFLEVNHKGKTFDILPSGFKKEFGFINQQCKNQKGREIMILMKDAYEFAEKELTEQGDVEPDRKFNEPTINP